MVLYVDQHSCSGEKIDYCFQYYIDKVTGVITDSAPFFLAIKARRLYLPQTRQARARVISQE